MRSKMRCRKLSLFAGGDPPPSFAGIATRVHALLDIAVTFEQHFLQKITAGGFLA
jgi:hypothetical protein